MLKTSLFDKGIYESQLSRFKWGSLLYFLLLFFSTSFLILITDFAQYSKYSLEIYAKSGGMILSDEYLAFPIVLAMIVPTVMAFLAFDMFSSKRQSVFIHSLPCGRNAIYISTMLGAFTLMAAPVIANGIILMLLSVFKYGELYSVYACFKWIAANLILLFIMFSVAVLSAGLTSSRFALVFVNCLLHVFPVITVFCTEGLAVVYLYGFTENFNDYIQKTLAWLPAFSCWSPAHSGRATFINHILGTKYLIFLGVAIVLYLLGLLLYKKRKNETAGNFVTFKILNPIFKYTITAFGVLTTFSILHFGELERNFYMLFLLVVISLVLYFASEMVLKKNLKVFGAYKGYLVFVAVCVAVNLFMEYTGFFGYEKRIPDSGEIASVSVSNGYLNERDKPYTEDKEVIEDAVAFHKEIVSDIPRLVENNDENRRIEITYKLQNGKRLTRHYRDINVKKYDEIFRKLYEHKSYRIASDDILKLDADKIEYLMFSFEPTNNFSYNFGSEEKNNLKAFLKEWEKDVAELRYDEKSEEPLIYLNMEQTKDMSDTAGNFHIYRGFNSNYKNVMSYLEEKGYLEKIYKAVDADVCISKDTHSIETKVNEKGKNVYYFDGEQVEYRNEYLEKDEVMRISDEDKGKLLRAYVNGEIKNRKDAEGEIYLVYLLDAQADVFERYNRMLLIPKEELPEYLEKYVR